MITQLFVWANITMDGVEIAALGAVLFMLFQMRRSVCNAAGVKANGQENGGCDGERLWTPARARLWLKPMADQGGLCLSGKIYISFLSVDDPDWRVQNANISRSGSPRKFKRDHVYR